ncbi:MAG: class I SAM-dependent methyltransferase [Acidobacteriia bacterium]|nr:class I SAM-dependent methyltransferase [Terriglobia bacterium]
MSLDELLRDRKVWETKEVLRLVYTRQFFPRLSQNRVPGFRTVEVGAGPGLYKQFAPDVLSSDITVCPWHDLAANGEHLPFAAASLDNVIGLDVVHHLNNPLSFFCESARVLRAAGRVVLIEPWMTPFGYLVNRCFIPEECDLTWQPGEMLVQDQNRQKRKDPFEANSAVPYLLFNRFRHRLRELMPELRLVKIERFALFGYLLSMGFRETSLLPARLYPYVERLESATRSLWEPVAALKALIVLERV